MPATITIKGISITAVHDSGLGSALEYDGEVSFLVQSPADSKTGGGIEFGYVYRFTRSSDLAQSIRSGKAHLKTQLSELASEAGATRVGP